ncbi:hypothetical protein [Actinomadura citrea]|uniref:Uncharacterized protein n=1 Tax=Actinomadura citrea TaxID=46158 RepID=A0A7Y9GF19_9ACTN|nr:hypothetical protein [Actinomadura citrea]NYE15343.1 hypothetical protein [Actinomadura citrea]GGT99898.1 hypothetical protein GCM10010177_68840 [Actinomadura citrea]
MDEVMNILLIRFAIIVAGIALLVVAVFSVAIMLRRHGRLGRARGLVEPALRAWADRPAAGPGAGRGGLGARRGGGRSELGRLAARGALHYLDQAETRGTGGDR